MRPSRIRPFLALLPLLALGLEAAAVEPTLAVREIEVRFARGGGADSRLTLRGDLDGGASRSGYDPATTPLRISVGPVVLLDGPPWREGARIRTTTDGWRLDLPADRDGAGRVTFDLLRASGEFTVKARGVDADALAGGGLDGVTVEVRLGEDVFATTLDLEERGPRRWRYRSTTPPPPLPPGGGGGGGGGGLVTLAQGAYSGITATRFEVVRDQASWDSLWAQHAAGGAPPAVDFDTEMVVGLWLGLRTTGGYTVDIFRITAPYTVIVGGWCPPPTDPPIGAPCFGGAETPGLLAEARETRPGPTCVVSTGATFPFHIVKAPRAEGPGVFSLLDAVRTCP